MYINCTATHVRYGNLNVAAAAAVGFFHVLLRWHHRQTQFNLHKIRKVFLHLKVEFLKAIAFLTSVGSLFHLHCNFPQSRIEPNRTRTHAKRLCVASVCMFQMLRVLEILLFAVAHASVGKPRKSRAVLSEFSAHQASASLSLFLLWTSSSTNS